MQLTQIDQAAIERAVSSAVERERATWRRKLEQGRARFRQHGRGGVLGWATVRET